MSGSPSEGGLRCDGITSEGAAGTAGQGAEVRQGRGRAVSRARLRLKSRSALRAGYAPRALAVARDLSRRPRIVLRESRDSKCQPLPVTSIELLS